jgi:hypothetical protein
MCGFADTILPQTFKDAVAITRKLRIDYLWIDSLCIYQDIPSDWQTEAGSMAEVYSRSFCNIAATSARDSSGGCFFDRDQRMVVPGHIDTPSPELLETQIIGPPGYIIPKQYRIYAEDFWEQGMMKQPLLQRGWVVQERLLASRTIHFSQPQIFWECRHSTACEVFPQLLPGYLTYDPSQTWKQNQVFSGEHPVKTIWKTIIKVYSTCHLTVEQDKLPAIEGLAISMKEETLGRYLAGLWEGDFCEGLAWYQVPWTTNSRQKQYRAPSWSWASVDGPVHYYDTSRDLVSPLKIITVDGRLDGLNHDQRNDRWKLRVEGPLVLKAPQIDPDVARYEIYLDGGLMCDTSGLPLLPLWFGDWSAGGVVGIVLRPTKRFDGELERVGFFFLKYHEKPGLDSPLLAAHRMVHEQVIRGAPDIPREVYASKRTETDAGGLDTHLYTFTIV